ncbi:MAG: hypothetical protein ABWY63_00985 [Hyphomicrobiaceae bacterium]
MPMTINPVTGLPQYSFDIDSDEITPEELQAQQKPPSEDDPDKPQPGQPGYEPDNDDEDDDETQKEKREREVKEDTDRKARENLDDDEEPPVP